ncbi:hypothetical protein FB451DRAFT_1237036 [Mycena latifolia]|nr:hypothetical protein FB451DRAFT_1237036 [Mycena latifolia]
MNPLQFPVLLVGEVVSFCVDMVLMAIYAFLTAFALCAVFLGLTTLGPIFATLYPLFARKESKVAGWRFPFESLKASRRRAKAKAHATRPPTLSHRWTVYTWKVLHVKRFDGISPFVLFLSVFVPAVLLCFLLHHRRQVTKVREAETLKRLSVSSPPPASSNLFISLRQNKSYSPLRRSASNMRSRSVLSSQPQRFADSSGTAGRLHPLLPQMRPLHARI